MKNNNRKRLTEGERIIRKLKAQSKAEKNEENFSFVPEQQTSSKLREFLNSLKDNGTIDEDYQETELYSLGYSDGLKAGHESGYQEAYYAMFKVLKAIETIIEPHVEREC